MVFHKVKYITFSGVKEIIEVPIKKTSKWVIYEDNIPKYFVDFFDLEKESNAIMNSLVLCSKQSIETVLALINKKNNVKLSVPKVSSLGLKIKTKSEIIKLDLPPIPEKWLSYSM
jgi:hypothetical protein